MCLIGAFHLHGYDLESTILKASEDFANEVALDTIWLNHDEAAFCGHFVFRIRPYRTKAGELEVIDHLWHRFTTVEM
jgi:hypothetical protein